MATLCLTRFEKFCTLLAMKIQQLATVNFAHYWVTTSKQGEIRVVEKDPPPFRWIKMIFYIFSLTLIDVYAHTRISRFTKAFWDHFEIDFNEDPECRDLYTQVISNIRTAGIHMGETNVKLLENLREKISSFEGGE